MRSILLLSIVLIFSVMTGCESGDSEGTVPENTKKDEQGLGPFKLVLSSPTTMLQNKFSAQIAQKEGKVEFNFPAKNKTTWMQIRFAHTTVTGCDENKVEVLKAWKPYKEGNPQVISDQYFSAEPGEDATLMVVFKNIGGCKTLSFNMIVDHVTDPYKVPKSWGVYIDPEIEGSWKNQAEGVSVSVDNNYVHFESTKNQFCSKTLNYPLTDTTQLPNYLGVDANSETLCRYMVQVVGGKKQLSLHCFQITDWSCTPIHNLKLTQQ